MVISPTDATAALHAIERTEARGIEARSYRRGGAILMLWGGIWAVAYTTSGLLAPDRWWVAWVPGILIGMLGTLLFGQRGGQKWAGFRPGGITLVSLCLLTALYAIDPPHTAHQAEVLPPLVIAHLYALIGLRGLPRFFGIGAFLFVATLIGYFAVPQYFAFWMAAIGGGTLIASGLWLRAA